MEPIVNQPVRYEELRKQVVQIPGKQVITQPVVQEYFQRDDIHHFQNPVFEEVRFNRRVPIPTPVVVKVPTKREIPIAIPSRQELDVEQVIIKEVDTDRRSSEDDMDGGWGMVGPHYERNEYGHGHGKKYGHGGAYGLEEASWIQDGLHQLEKNKNKEVHPYHNSLSLEDSTFFNGYGNMMGNFSNLGFDQ